MSVAPLATLAALCGFTVATAGAQVVINEIYYDPPDNTKATEFIELHNPTGAAVSLAGWKLENAVDYTFPAGASLAAGGYLVIAENAAAFQTAFGFAPAGVFTGGLSADGENIVLRNAATAVVDEVSYGVGFPWPTAAKGTGSSMELIHPGLDNNLGGSWRSSGTPDNPTPQTTFIPITDTAWRWRKGTSEASNPRTAWRLLNFVEDATWSTGRTSVGFGDSDDNTVLTDMQNSYWSIFLRHTFTVPAGALPTALLLRVRVDDGCVVWINGQWVASFNTTTDDPLYNTAAVNHEGDVWQEKVLTGVGSYLVNGTNIVAVLASNTTLGSSDFSIDAELKTSDPATNGAAPTPGAQNSIYAANAAPAVRQVEHAPQQPTSNVPVTVTAKVTDPDGVGTVTLSYQEVLPGSYIRKSDATYETAWTSVPMVDNGTAGDAVAGDSTFTAVLPAGIQTHRKLVRYRIVAADALGKSARAPYLDDEQPNFAYFVYDGCPAWTARNQPPASAPTTFPTSLFTTLPVYQLIANETDVLNSQYNSSYDTIRFWGTMVYDGKVYDHIEYHNKGSASTYQSGKNKWRFHFARARDFEARDTWGRKYGQTWDTFTMHACASPWNPVFRGWAGLDEVVSARVYALAGVPAPALHHLHFRVVSNATEAPADQYSGDVWGLYTAVEDPDGSFLDERGLPDGNVYHIASSAGDKTHQAPTQPSDTSDWDTFRNGSTSRTGNTPDNETWWRANMDIMAYASFHAGNRITGNVDLREGWNHYFYHRSSDNRWLPIPWDLDMMYFPETHWSGTIDQKNCLLMSGISVDFKNRCRELLDLICEDGTATGGQIGQLVDEYKRVIRPAGQAVGWDLLDQYKWNYNPRSANGHSGAFYLPNPRSDSRIGGTWTRTYTTADFLGVCDYMVAYATDTDPNTFAVGDGDQRGYGYNYLELEAADTAIPSRPTVSYIGTAGYPANDLRFQTTAFADPQGTGTFAAIQWRMGEIAAPGVAGYTAGDPFTYEITDVWTSAEVTTFDSQVRVPTLAARPGHTYRVRVRMKDNTGRWSRWSPAAQFVAGTPDVGAYVGSLVITEVMYRPAAASDPEKAAGFTDEDFEFIELRNVGTTSLDLTDVRFTKGVDFDFAPGTALAAGAAALVVKNQAAFTLRYGAGLPVVGSYGSDSLDNAGERLKLSYGAGTAIRDFTYAPAAPWPAVEAGQSLVLKLPATNPDHAVATNWRASHRTGGNPGGRDSLSFASFAAAYGIAAPGPDPDRDGMSNGLEYAFGTDPTNPTSASQPLAATTNVNVNGTVKPYFTIAFRHPENIDDLIYTPQFSSTLDGWTGSGERVTTVQEPDGFVTELWRAPQPIESAGRVYSRVLISQP